VSAAALRDSSFRAGRRVVELPPPLLHAALAAALAAAITKLGPPGTDLAAHVYQRDLFIEHGYSLWNNFWYAGRYTFVTYSLLYYPLAAVLGIKLLAVASVAAGSGAFTTLVEREWGAAGRWPARLFAVVWAASVVTAAFPYTLGLALALLALVALQARRRAAFGTLVALTFATSPLAFVLLGIVLAAALVRSGRVSVRVWLPVFCTAAAGALLWRVFPNAGHFPFSPTELGTALAFSGLGIAFTWRVERARLLCYLFCAYALTCTLAYLVSSEVGANVLRVRFVAVPLVALALSLRGWKPLAPALAALALATWWNASPLASSIARGASDPSSAASYWSPAIGFLKRELGPSYRVEAVDTVGHWDAVYLAEAGIPIVRGWYRQDDFPQNELLYGPLGRRAYVAWLHRMAVRYVVLTSAPRDYSTRREALLLRSGHSGLRVVYRSTDTVIFSVPAPRRIVTGPGRPRVLALRNSSLVLALHRPGSYRVALRYSPYWAARGACISRAADGMVDLTVRRPGTLRLQFAVTASRALGTMTGSVETCRR
jgi:hypothetical protein